MTPANDIRDALPTTVSAGLVGARMQAAAMRRPVEMVPVGWEASTLLSTHGKHLRTWLGVAS